MAGYSGTSLQKKLGIKPGTRALFVNEPASLHNDLGTLPGDVIVREIGLAKGLVDVKVCAVSDVWSGLKVVVRKELRTPGRPAPAASK